VNPVIVPALTVLAVRVIAAAEQLVLLWWRDRQERAYHHFLMRLAQALPGGSKVEQTRPDGGELHLAIASPVGSAGGPPR
jgi:hypothetical protein